MTPRRHMITGIALIAVGVLFLMVSNGILLGWEHVWPLFPLAAGIFVLRAHHRRPGPWLVFTGVTATMLGLFFLIFSTGILSWDRMAALWPMFPAVAGLAFIGESLVAGDRNPSFIIGSTIVLFAAVAFLLESGTVNSRVAAPFIRFWPLALILAGIILLKSSPSKRTVDPDMEVVRQVLADAEDGSHDLDEEIPPGLQTTILDRVRDASSPDGAVAALVHGLKANFARYSWVGIYRLTGKMLTLSDNDFVGSVPEHRTIRLGEGICGAAAKDSRTIVVPDVCADERYLACSPTVKSEIVLPISVDDQLIGVLDIDSNRLDAFSPLDRRFLEELIERAAPHLRVGTPA